MRAQICLIGSRINSPNFLLFPTASHLPRKCAQTNSRKWYWVPSSEWDTDPNPPYNFRICLSLMFVSPSIRLSLSLHRFGYYNFSEGYVWYQDWTTEFFSLFVHYVRFLKSESVWVQVTCLGSGSGICFEDMPCPNTRRRSVRI